RPASEALGRLVGHHGGRSCSRVAEAVGTRAEGQERFPASGNAAWFANQGTGKAKEVTAPRWMRRKRSGSASSGRRPLANSAPWSGSSSALPLLAALVGQAARLLTLLRSASSPERTTS